MKLPQHYNSLVIEKLPINSYFYAISEILREFGKSCFFVALNEAEGQKIVDSLDILLPDYEILFFPNWDNLPYDRVSPNKQSLSRRLKVLYKLLNLQKKEQKFVLVSTANTILTKILPQDILLQNIFSLQEGQKISQEKIIEYAISNSYDRVDSVIEEGEFSVKGGILDIFPVGRDKPVRLDFLADNIELIKSFDPVSQLSNEKVKEILILPSSEVILQQEYIANFKQKYRENFSVNFEKDLLYEAISTGRSFAGMEHWLPYFYKEELESIFAYLPDDCLVINDNLFSENLEKRIEAIEDYFTTRKSLNRQQEEVYNPVAIADLYLKKEEIEALLQKKERMVFDNFSSQSDYRVESLIKNIPNFYSLAKQNRKVHSNSGFEGGRLFKKGGVGDLPLFRGGEMDPLPKSEILTSPQGGGYLGAESKELHGSSQGGGFAAANSPFSYLRGFIEEEELVKKRKIIFAAHSEISLKRIKDILGEYEFSGAFIKEADFIKIPLTEGFIAEKVIFISEQDLFGAKIIRKYSSKKQVEKLLREAESLCAGEIIVHKENGIGKFIGLTSLTLGGKEHEFAALEYSGGDKLYVPVENLDLISRYGNSNPNVKLDRLGSGSFQLRKSNLKGRIKDIAADLIKIASNRELSKGLRFRADPHFLEEFEASFPFDETEDQLKSINDVYEDLDSGKNMERLICGDVGFGKTEVAMRAAFAVLSSNSTKEKPQVAIIAPTTLLSRQHYNSFVKRFSSFGFTVKQLSRMVSVTEKKKTKELLEEGRVDIVIGTHALLSKNLKFKNLCLAIIDEEQHFGVSQKEQIKKFRENIHLLTLSATPIPRTLQMSLNGIRDMSLLTTPPVDRIAIRSTVMPFDSMIIKDAIMREYYRGGRIFYVCPKIKQLEKEAEKIRKLTPDIRFTIAHGGLKPEILDKIMNDFCDGKYDLLLSTSIVESGIDIANANTIIVHHADNFGLSALYQLRGRVGRSNIRAYSYFTFEDRKKMTEQAEKRLQVMQRLDGLGAGFTIASHDLDIRGAGNLLGEQQSGKINEVGVELYQQMLGEEIAKLQEDKDKIEKIEHNKSSIVNIGLSVLIPEEYIPQVNTRMEFYRRIAFLENEIEAQDMLLELENRFGKIPAQAENLVEVINIKNKCKSLNIEKLDAGPKALVITFWDNNFSNPENLINLVLSSRLTHKIKENHKLVISINSDESNRIIKINKYLDELLTLV